MGHKETPINAELLLENTIFLYEKGEKEVAIKTLLMVNTDSLTIDLFYKYAFLR